MIPNKIVTIFISILLVVLTIWVGVLTRNSVKAYRYIGLSAEQKHSINITGQGKVVAMPDIAKIQLGLQTEDKSVAKAQKDNTDKMNAVIDKLKKDFNIDDKDIQTANYNIYPQYDWANNRQVLRAYQVSQSVNVKIRDLNKISDILTAVGQAGLNQVSGLTFDVDEPENLKQQARELAIKNAQEKADALAKIADVKLGKVISFSEYSNEPPVPMPYESYAMKGAGIGGGGAAPAVEAGSTEIIMTVNVEYEIY
ncbi:MAG: SIMPL domain-containing protein [Patescibacteria group bacterium]